MSDVYNDFIKNSEITAFDKNRRKIVNTNELHYNNSVIKGKEQYKNTELAKLRAANLKHNVINDLDEYLIDFELNFSKNGGKVLWAQDKNEANDKIISILKKHDVKHVVKSKSSTCIEIELKDVLEKNKIKFFRGNLKNVAIRLPIFNKTI
jgi:L-lactate dehydrogenase complex protein LldF